MTHVQCEKHRLCFLLIPRRHDLVLIGPGKWRLFRIGIHRAPLSLFLRGVQPFIRSNLSLLSQYLEIAL
jgi:hypothetical protein